MKRREFLKLGAIATGAVAGGGVLKAGGRVASAHGHPRDLRYLEAQ